MAVRQDQVQLDIRFVTDESKALAKTIVDTKKYNDEIKAAQKNIADYRKELKDAGADEVKRAQALAKIAVEEAKVAKGFEDIAAAGKKVEGLDLSKVAPAQLVERARQLALEMRNIPQSAPRFKELQAELVRVNAQLRNVNEASKGSDKPGGGIIGNISSLITNGPRAIPIIGSIVAGFQALSGAFSGANKLEQLTISFETFLGSADKAKAVIADLKEFEVKTPFEAEQVNTAGRALLAFGFTTKELIPTLTRIGDIASGTGKDFNELALIYGKAKTQGLIQGEELNQLAEAGIPIYAELAKVLNVNENQIRKLGEQGKIQFKDLEQVFQNLAGAGGKFAGLMEKQSQSLGGLYSTLKSALSNLLTSVGTTLAPLAKGGMELLIGAVSILGKVITPVFKVFETFFKGAVEGAKLVANALGNNVPKAIQSMGEAFLNIPVLGDAFKFLLVPIRLVIDSFESLKATATGVVAGLVDIFTTGGQNVGKAYTDARNKVLQEERQQEARDRAEDARDERQLTAEEKAALLAAEKKAAKEKAELLKKEREEAQKKLEAALELALKAEEVSIKRKELFAENERFKGQITEDQYQQRLSDITEQGLKARLEVYKKFYREQSVEALALQNQLEAGFRQQQLAANPLDLLPTRNQPGVTSAQDNTTGNELALQAAADKARVFALKSRFESLLITENDYEQQRLELKRLSLVEEIAILSRGSEEQKALASKKGQELVKIEDELLKQQVENVKRTEKMKQSVQNAGLQASGELFSLSADLLLEDEKNRKKNASTIKAFQTAQVITNGILEVQKIWASVAEFGPAAPVIGGLLTGAAILRATLAINRIQKQKFAGGGYTGTGYGSPDETGYKPAGVVHEGEYVAPKSQVNHPVTGPVIRWLENRRLRGYATGGLVTLNTTPAPIPGLSNQPPVAVPGMEQFTAAVDMFSAVVASFPRSVKSSVVLTELEEQQATLDAVRSDAAI